MKKYLAVIKDSFREALYSRVLWLLLLGITLLLLAVVPLGYREVVTTQLLERDLRQPDELMVHLREEGPKERTSPTAAIWDRLQDKTRSRLTNISIQGDGQGPGNPFEFLSLMRVVREELNDQIQQPDFYDQEAWKNVVVISPEGRDLLKRYERKDESLDPLAGSELVRFNRLMLEAALPKYIRVSPPTSAQFKYAWMDAGSPMPVSGAQIRTMLKSSAASVLNLLVGAIGVFVAILVTAPVIPQMFDSGSLHLLLSKPVSRWLLFLAKYLGGCAFITVGAVYLIGGLWVILGTRFGVWEPRILWSIPIYLFVFAIYYSVSSLAAVIWRSPIVSIAVSILFWFACFIIGTTKLSLENMWLNKERFVRVLYAGDTLFGVDEFGWGYVWQEDSREWDDVFVLAEQRQARPFLLISPTVSRQFRAVGHVYDPQHERMLAAIPAFPPRTIHLGVAGRAENWEPITEISAPTGTVGMFRDPDGEIVIASSLGLSRLAGDPLSKKAPLQLFGWQIPVPASGPFQEVNPDPVVLITQPSDVAMHPANGNLVVYTRGMITVLERGKRRYTRRTEQRLDGDERQSAVVALGGEQVLVGRDDGRVQVRRASDLHLIHEFRPEDKNPPRFIEASPDGRFFAVVFHTGNLWLFDRTTVEMTKADVAGQGDISAANFHADGTLMVVDNSRRVSRYELDPVRLKDRISPKLGLLLAGYRYAILPLYTLFPKPGELDKTFQYLLSGKSTEAVDDSGDQDLTSAQRAIDPWAPLWSSAAFTAVVLLLACVYLELQEF